ncbi:hypothetical protein CYLTODRAFT_418711 [Cylindrobasidium torrendii FP15055 ss-10]|uniref:DUF803-domain-containing protein n=1 Tax=Cylindrobasidium torrendii FP15055 ss-10 TaxID=1314674 RepID=A0A0D7BN94_9AGAR|nr:hypothetical protein CYLTODRAFT_418711 [Cylindrobasidium torrendii FP15055 ss-10]
MRHALEYGAASTLSTASDGGIGVSIPAGIVIGLLASFVQSLGLTIQRKSHVQNQRLPEDAQKIETRRPLWLIGFAIFISSNILGSFVQIASLPVVILAPLGAVSLLWNAFFARILLGDVFSPWMILGTLLIAGGAVLIAIFGIVPEPTRSLEDLLALFHRGPFVIYFSLLGVFVVICLAATHIAEYALQKKIRLSSSAPSTRPPSISYPPTTADPSILTTGVTDLTETIATEATPLIDPKVRETSKEQPFIQQVNRSRLIIAISYASFSGILSGMCLLFAKSGTQLLVLTLGGDNQFWRWQAWMLVLALIVFALLQLVYLHKALVLANPTLVCPSAFCFYNLSSILNGLVYFDQFELIPPLYLGLVSLGIVILLAGVWVVSIHSGEGGEGSDSDESDTESAVIDLDSTSSLHGDSTNNWGSHSEPAARPAGLGLDLSLPRQSTISNGESIEMPRTPTSPGTTQRRRASGHGHGHHRSGSVLLTPPLPRSKVSTLAETGFQIGLSATSPGFSIMPMERRGRRVSNMSPRERELAEAMDPWADRDRPRRSVSEGDAARDGDEEEQQPLLQQEEDEQEDLEQSPRPEPPRQQGKWGWVGRVLSKKRT